MGDAFTKKLDRVESPARNWEAVTPSDSVNFTTQPKALHVAGTAGNIACVGDDGTVATFYGAQGAFLPISPVRVNLTGTSATSIVALFG